MANKQEYPPILPAGLHKTTVAQLKAKAVDAFPTSPNRAALWSNFEWLLAKLTAARLPCQIWVDGSFLTKKGEPADIDLVVDVRIDRIQAADAAQTDLLGKLTGQAWRAAKKLHSFVMFTAPVGHNAHGDSIKIHNQWTKDFGFAYVSKTPKGIALVEVLP